MNFSALCSPGCDKVLINEIKKLGASGGWGGSGGSEGSGGSGRGGEIGESESDFKIAGSFFGRVRFSTDLKGAYLALMSLRTCDRILLELASFDAHDFDALFENCKKIPIENYVPEGSVLAVEKVRSRASVLRSERTVQAMVHKALIERFNAKAAVQIEGQGGAPDESRSGDGARVESRGGDGARTAFIRVYIEKNRVDVLLDISGESLYKRGYRAQGGLAPLRETGAAAVILMSGWKRKFPLVDPFCGSGTIAIEALLYACNIAPNLERAFDLDRLLPGERANAAAIKEETRKFLKSQINLDNPVTIAGSDKDNSMIESAKRNLQNALRLYGLGGGLAGGGLAAAKKLISFNTLPMEDLKPYSDRAGFIITNPPYGNRLQDIAGAEENYRNMRILRDNFPNWKLVVISDNIGFEDLFGVKSDSMTAIKRGAASLCVYQYNALGGKGANGKAPPTTGRPFGEKPAGRMPFGEKPAAKRRGGGKPFDKKRAGEKPPIEKAGGGKPAMEYTW